MLGVMTCPIFKNPFNILFAASLVTNFLVMWEVFEYGMDTYLDLNMQKDGIKDTMEDILIGKLGCAIVSIFYWWKDYET